MREEDHEGSRSPDEEVKGGGRSTTWRYESAEIKPEEQEEGADYLLERSL